LQATVDRVLATVGLFALLADDTDRRGVRRGVRPARRATSIDPVFARRAE
jgi:hypothetical protein